MLRITSSTVSLATAYTGPRRSASRQRYAAHPVDAVNLAQFEVSMPADPVGALQARHEADGLAIHARTAMPGWLGERLDVGWAIDVLHPLANPMRRPFLDQVPTALAALNDGETHSSR